MNTTPVYDDYSQLRRRMVREQIVSRGITDERLLAAMERVPRHLFVDALDRHQAYEDHPLSIGYGQTISQPYIVSFMTDLLNLKGAERVLDIGTGSGYQAAILSELAAEVHSVEFRPELILRAQSVLDELGYKNIQVHEGDGSLGWSAESPFDAILVAAYAPRAPRPLLNQLADGGRLVVPVGDRSLQHLEVWERYGDDLHFHPSIPVAFVPLYGEYGVNTVRK